jgi:hypothetical protein
MKLFIFSAAEIGLYFLSTFELLWAVYRYMCNFGKSIFLLL